MFKELGRLTAIVVGRTHHTGPKPAWLQLSADGLPGQHVFILGYSMREWECAISHEIIPLGGWAWRLSSPQTMEEARIRISLVALPYAIIPASLGTQAKRHGY